MLNNPGAISQTVFFSSSEACGGLFILYFAVLTEEVEVPFYEHVFLEDKLNEGNWCPKEGPIRSFMLSVTTALSLNPYLTVREKHEHIQWFRDYFTERITTIKNLGLVQ